jgi:hypothetical protein
MSRLTLLAISAGALLGLAACTLDSLIVLQQPAEVGKGESFQVGAVDIILDAGSASAPADSVYRDSIHVGLGLPAGWEVVAAKACPAPHFRPALASINKLDTNLRNRLLQDSLDACESRAFDLVQDPGIQAYLKGRTLRATASPESLGRSFNLKVDTVPQWFGFSGRIDVSVPAGAPADTVLDTLAFKALPVFIHLTLKAPDRDEGVRLVYFSKTGRLDTAAFSDAANQDRGALVYRPVRVGSPTSSGRGTDFHGFGRSAGLRLHRAPGGGYLVLLPSTSGAAPSSLFPSRLSLELRDASGALLRAWPMQELEGRSSLSWDGLDLQGRPLGTGIYFLALSMPEGRFAASFVVLR